MKKFFITVLAVLVTVFLLDFPFVVKADDITSQVEVNNDPPAFVADGVCTGNYPCESPARDDSSPVNVGTGTTFRVTANEPNGEDYYLIVCKTDSFTEHNDGPPTCAAGETICVSSAIQDGDPATCNYDAVQGDLENQPWYAKVCDDNTTDQACSSSTQGNGAAPDEASPLAVNHAPYISALDNDASSAPTATAPGQLVTWTTTAIDPDGIGGDTIDLHVCDSNSFDGTDCGDTELCSDTGQGANPSCQYQIPAGTDDDASPYSAYAFIVDNHDFDPSVSSSSAYYVANVAPEILDITTTANDEGAISLLGGESATTSANFVVTIQDNNGCGDISTPTDYVLYRWGVPGNEACSGNVNNCYTGDSGDYKVTCDAGSSCGAFPDVETVYTCSVELQYHADPTVDNTPWAYGDWISYFNIDDDDAEADTASASGIELNMLQALDSTDLDYGSMDAGTNDATLDDSNTITATGNVALDAEVSSDAPMDDGNGHTIAVDNQRADETSGTAWGSAAIMALSGTLQEIEVDCTKTTITGSPETDAIYWGISIPSDQFPGTYTGTTTVAAKYSEVGQGW